MLASPIVDATLAAILWRPDAQFLVASGLSIRSQRIDRRDAFWFNFEQYFRFRCDQRARTWLTIFVFCVRDNFADVQ
jgi:hypothetical protein